MYNAARPIAGAVFFALGSVIIFLRSTPDIVFFILASKCFPVIINISSIFGREYGGKSASYMASKASLIAATKHQSIDLADKGVTVNSIAPGSVKHEGGSWEIFENNSSKSELEDFIRNNHPMKDFGTPEPIGDMVSFLSSPRSYLITGACINIDGGQSSNLF